MTLSKLRRFCLDASLQQLASTLASAIKRNRCLLWTLSLLASKRFALAHAHRIRQPNPHSVGAAHLI
jgi:hypothetical protein